jgi:hypothetical protein
VGALVDELLAGSAEFARLWAAHDVRTEARVRKTVNHRLVGPRHRQLRRPPHHRPGAARRRLHGRARFSGGRGTAAARGDRDAAHGRARLNWPLRPRRRSRSPAATRVSLTRPDPGLRGRRALGRVPSSGVGRGRRPRPPAYEDVARPAESRRPAYAEADGGAPDLTERDHPTRQVVRPPQHPPVRLPVRPRVRAAAGSRARTAHGPCPGVPYPADRAVCRAQLPTAPRTRSRRGTPGTPTDPFTECSGR